MQGLKDIKSIVEVHGYTPIYLIITVIVSLLIVAALLFMGYRYFKNKRRRKRKSKIEMAKERLKNINFNDPKEAVYTFSEYANILAQNSLEKKESLEPILKEIEIYKYKKEVPPLSNEAIKKMKQFIKAV